MNALKVSFNNRFYILYLTPFLLGMLSTLSFMPFNLIIVNFVILPFIFYLIVHINKNQKTYTEKNLIKKFVYIRPCIWLRFLSKRNILDN